MPRRSVASVRVDPNLRCLRVYPTERTQKRVTDLKTIGIKLSQEQAIHLARVLMAVSQDWAEVEITVYRGRRRQSDGTHQLTVTHFE